MKLVQINTTCGVGSTGKICVGISKLLTERGVQNRILYSCDTSGYSLGVACSDHQYQKVQALKSRVFGNYGFNSGFATQKIIGALEQFHPDVVHLHNIHGHDCNLERLFSYFRKNHTRLVWTFHDCWAFTGYCTHFTMAKCDKWKQGCSKCPLRRDYSWFFDRSSAMFNAKKRLFQGQNLTIVTPSDWLAGLVKQSFLMDVPVRVIHNGIDLEVFRPSEGDFRQKHGLEKKKIVLGVAFDWGEKKGLDVFSALSNRLPEDYQIVLVGTDETVERVIPKEILSIRRTQNQKELAEIYTSADVLVNPTREDNFPTVNLEALACGTPVITSQTGGSPEMIDKSCGSVVDCEDVAVLAEEITRVCTQQTFLAKQCIRRAEDFEIKKRFEEYLELYERIVTSGTEGN